MHIARTRTNVAESTSARPADRFINAYGKMFRHTLFRLHAAIIRT